MLCAKCNYDNPADALFCMKCGAKVEKRCASCQTTNPIDANFCRKCGTTLRVGAIGPAPDLIATATTPRVEVNLERLAMEGLDGERKTVTALFADIKGSTELIERLDPEEARAIVDPVLHLMMQAVHRFGGYVSQSTGDGIFALFGAPIAHEDHPQRALHAALAMQQELRRYAERLRNEGKIPIEARVGVNTGEVVVRTIETGGHTEYTPVGHVTNLAARMQTAAPAGSIAASEATQRLCEGYFEFRALGPTAVKGLNTPIEVYEVVRAGPLRTHFQLSARRGLTRFVGREREMAALAGALEQARAGHGQIVAAVGEAGAGKSRLMYEFKATLPNGWKLLEAYSVSHGKASAYLSVIDLLRNYFRFANEDDERTRREKVTVRVVALDRSLEDILPYLLNLLGIIEGDDPLAQMDGRIKKRRTLEAIKRILLRESLNQPLMVIFEDLHWIDGETQALLNLLADSIGTAKFLLLVNYRPEYSHQWNSKTYYTQLRLDPLGTQSADKMLTALLGDGPDLISLKQLIIERTEGTPFFMEETVQVLFDEGALARNGTVKLTKSLNELKIPPTVQAILAARIDRLPSDQKTLLQTLAVIGREFVLSLVKAVTGPNPPRNLHEDRASTSPGVRLARSRDRFGGADDDLERILADLQMAEFIYERPAAGDIEYIFKHALTQEVAYNSLLIERRKLLHERAGEALESLFTDRLDDNVSELARHYSNSGNLEKAVQYLERAGRCAVSKALYEEATTNFTQALASLRRIPDASWSKELELALQMGLGQCALVLKGFAAPEVERFYTRAEALCEQLGDRPELFSVLHGLCYLRIVRGDAEQTYASARQLVSVARRTKSQDLLLEAYPPLGMALFTKARFAEAIEALELGTGLYDRDRHCAHASLYGLDPAVACSCWWAWSLWLLGFADKASKRVCHAVSLSKESSHFPSQIFALSYLAVIHQLRRNPPEAAEGATRALALASEHGMTLWLGWTKLPFAWASGTRGGWEKSSINELSDAWKTFESTGANWSKTYFLACLADAHRGAGDPRSSLSAAQEGLRVASRTGEHFYRAELHRLKGESLTLTGDLTAAQVEFRCAIEIAQSQNAKSWELRATMSLARLLAEQGRRPEARAMLSEIYGWFTEGFDTADLKDAKALLGELNG